MLLICKWIKMGSWVKPRSLWKISINQIKTKSSLHHCNLRSLFRSCKNVKLLIHTPSVEKNILTSSASKKSSFMQQKTKSVMNIITTPHRMLTESSSLKPFPKIDPEFYSEKKDVLWDKEITRIKSEKSIFSEKKTLNRSLNESMSKNFFEVWYFFISPKCLPSQNHYCWNQPKMSK